MNWMTVKELAKYLKLSEMMVYKLAQTGEIPAAKIGSAWRFSQSEIDGWLISKCGKTKTEVDHRQFVPESVARAIDAFVAGLKKEFGGNFASLIVFGSYARGEAEEGSDVDVLVVVRKITDYWKVQSAVQKIAWSSTFEKDNPVVLAPVLMDETEFLAGSSPLLINIRKEGKKAA